MYIGGTQEAFTARAGWKERGLTVSTKWYPRCPGGNKGDVVREQVETWLRELQTDQIDMFYLHGPDRSVPFTETLETVNTLYKEGKVRRLGLSNYTAFEVADIVMLCVQRGWVRPTVFRTMYNALSRARPSVLRALPVTSRTS